VILQTSGVSKRFGGLKAVDNVSFGIAENAIQSIIGPNGAGKTTFFNLITGATGADSGRIAFLGGDITGYRPDRLFNMGLVRTFQRTSIFRACTALENVQLALRSREGLNQSILFSGTLNRRIEEEASAILAKVGLAKWQSVLAGTLAHGSQRALDIAIGLAGRPKLMLMDEPMAGMARGDRAKIAELILDLRATLGLSIVIVEHDIAMVMRLSDRITVMQHGSIIAEGTPDEIRQNDTVKKAYLHGSFAA
jgi:branched-chain amino acid transport system ATP-binding protein